MTEAERASEGARTARLVGRDAELALLVTAVGAAPAAAVVEGPPGVGKTRLLAEIERSFGGDGRSVLAAGCAETPVCSPLEPLARALARSGAVLPSGLDPRTGVLRPFLPAHADGLPPEPERLGDARAERRRVLDGAVALLSSLDRVLLILDDLPRADALTVDLVTLLLMGAAPGVTIAVSAESRDRARVVPKMLTRATVPVTRVAVKPFTRSESREMLSRIAGRAAERAGAAVYERTRGLPFALEEAVALLGGGDDAALPPRGLQACLRRRIRALPPGARQVLAAAAALGRPAAARELAFVARESGPGSVGAATRSGLLVLDEDGMLRLKHRVVGTVAAASGEAERRLLHARCASVEGAATTPGGLAALARHHREAGDERRWVATAEKAADAFAARHDHDGAAAALEEALRDGSVPLDVRARLAGKLGAAARYATSPVEAMVLLRGVVEEPELGAEVRAHLRLTLGRLLLEAGSGEEGWSEVRAAATSLEHDPAVAAEAMALLARPSSLEGRLGDHLWWLDRASALLPALGGEARTSLLVARATTLLACGDPEAWRAVAELPVRGATPGERRALMEGRARMASWAFHLGHHRHADAFLAEARSLAAETGDTLTGNHLAARALLFELARGRWDDLDERVDALAAQTSDSPAAAELELVAGALCRARGRVKEAHRLLTSASRTALAASELTLFLWAESLRVQLFLAGNRAAAARDRALAAVAVLRRKQIWVWGAEVLPVAVAALVECGDVLEARRIVAELDEGLRGRDAPAGRAAVSQCLATIASAEGRTNDAEMLFADAAVAWRELDRPLEAALAGESAAHEMLWRDRAAGAAAVRAVLGELAALGAEWDHGRARRRAIARGVELARGVGRRSALRAP